MLVVFLDIKQAFDSCNYTNLLNSLLQNWIKGKAHKLLADFFSGRRLNVRIGNSYSDDNPALKGVPQGSRLSPLLILIIMADMPRTDHVQTLMYTDDI